MPRRPRATAHTLRGEEQIRQHISVEAARIMSTEGVRDFQTAKRKAALRLNIPDNKHLPTNEEVEAALREYLQLFHASRLASTLDRLRRLALEAMQFFAKFEPRLVGPVLSGTVTAESAIQLHICSDTPEEVALLLHEHDIPYDESDRRVRYGGERQATCPVYRFTVDASSIEVYVFSPLDMREPPLSPVNGKPMKRAGLKQLEALLSRSTAPARSQDTDG
jgi:hypothetical protein